MINDRLCRYLGTLVGFPGLYYAVYVCGSFRSIEYLIIWLLYEGKKKSSRLIVIVVVVVVQLRLICKGSVAERPGVSRRRHIGSPANVDIY